MRKLLLSLIISICAAVAAHAQSDNTRPQFSFGISPGVAVGPVSSVYPDAGELVLKLTYPIAHSPVSVTFTTGYTFYTSGGGYDVGFDYDGFGYESGGESYSYGDVAAFVPVMAGVKIYIAKKFFIIGEAGASFNVNSNPGYYTGRSAAFIYSPGVGYTIPLDYRGRRSAELGLAYENRLEPGGGYSQIAFRAAYNFSL